MMGLEDIRKDRELIDMIDWEMTPEEAVTLYLEWGNNWSHGGKMVRSKNDVSLYFVVNTWENPPIVCLVRRNSEEAVEIAAIEMPEKLREQFLDYVGRNKGVYAPNESVRDWLAGEIFGDDFQPYSVKGPASVN